MTLPQFSLRRDNPRRERNHGTYLQTRHFQEYEDNMAAFQATESGGKHNQASLFTVYLLDTCKKW